MMSGFSVSRSLMPASSTNSDSSGEYMSGSGMPTSSGTFSMPFSCLLHLSAFSDGKLMQPPAMFMSLPSCWRSLSLAVMDATLAPLRENSARIVVERMSSGPVMDDRLSRLRFEIEVPGYPVDRGRAAGDDRHVVGAGEARNDALGDRAKPHLHEASDVGYDSVFKCSIEIRGIAAIVANDNNRPVRPAIPYAIEANL